MLGNTLCESNSGLSCRASPIRYLDRPLAYLKLPCTMNLPMSAWRRSTLDVGWQHGTASLNPVELSDFSFLPSDSLQETVQMNRTGI